MISDVDEVDGHEASRNHLLAECADAADMMRSSEARDYNAGIPATVNGGGHRDTSSGTTVATVSVEYQYGTVVADQIGQCVG